MWTTHQSIQRPSSTKCYTEKGEFTVPPSAFSAFDLQRITRTRQRLHDMTFD